ncbi:MAG: hypothetical protein VXW89_03565 [Candidatus Thermoplasmatota archaeon]|nr:hypothetical protein [Candidatus Thermoplasmatota archaeon]MEC8384088.1 hypothetical protein [Candidatus Thermoplasmatota archaeon]MED5375394.1 hypothetical protein [Candidatus Thermoplasmatota archaeon]
MDGDEGRMADRLDTASRVTVDQIDIPPEYRPTDLEAWLFTPGATRVGFMGDMGSKAPSGSPPSSGSSTSGPPPDELLKMLADRFERLEASIGHMETNLALGHASSPSSSSDVMHTIGEDGEVKTISLGNSDSEFEGMDAVHAGPGLLDLYEAQSLALNPFLRSRDSEISGPGVDPAKIAALILDNLSGHDAQLFIQAAAKSGFLTSSEAKTLSGITSLAQSGESSGNATLPNRPLLTFVAMVEAWRSQSSTSSGNSSIPSAPMVDFEPGE